MKQMIAASVLALSATSLSAQVIEDKGIVSEFTVGARVKAVPIETIATDDSGEAGITQKIYINGKLVATAYGGSMTYRWNTVKLKPGNHEIKVTAQDEAGNMSIIRAIATRL